MSGVLAKQLTNTNPLTFSADNTTDEIVRMMVIRIEMLKFLLKRDVSFEEATHALNWVNDLYIKGVVPHDPSS